MIHIFVSCFLLFCANRLCHVACDVREGSARSEIIQNKL